MSERDKNRLSTWKEIAAFLSCDVRTCLRWEKERGLPVHRPEGGSKSRVYAWKDELEAWMKGRSNDGASFAASLSSPSQAPPVHSVEGTSAGRRPGSLILFVVLTAIAVFAAVFFFIYRALTLDRNPADFHIRDSKLQIVNQAGTLLWEHDTKVKDLYTEDEFRIHFNKKNYGRSAEQLELPFLMIRDIDGDGKNEVLFTPATRSSLRAGQVFCFDYRGIIKWAFVAGRELTFANKTYSRDYWCRFDAGDFNGDNRQEILVLAGHAPDWPSQVTLLSASDGKTLGEYWNSGRMIDYLSEDLNGDGKKELALCGTNNEYKRGIIVIFDPWNIGGSSPNTGKYRCSELAPGTEKAYLLLPWSDIDPVAPPLNWSVGIKLQSNNLIYILTLANSLYFEINPQTLACRYVNFSNNFRALHEAAVKAGLAASVLDDAYLDKLRTSLEYWTGAGWTTTPTWIR